jgi:hypothetical protein
VSRSLTILICCLALAISLLPVPVSASARPPRHIRALASRSVVAVETAVGLRTGFWLGSAKAVIAGRAALPGTRLVNARGESFSSGSESAGTRLVVLRPTDGDVPGVEASTRRNLPTGTSAYVLGPPLGYEGGRVRRVVLPAVHLQSSRDMTVPGTLPASFSGAPVVADDGSLLGAVVAAGPRRWTLEPKAALLVLAASRGGDGGGVSIFSILAGALLVIGLCAGALLLRRRHRRNRAHSTARPVRRPSVDEAVEAASRGPLVMRRGPEGQEPLEDFEIVFRSREDT